MIKAGLNVHIKCGARVAVVLKAIHVDGLMSYGVVGDVESSYPGIT